ncbi:hypothetical protein, partial [Nonlabens ulvanivorans]|uniref:hypothetical protein n=1 Tax=Nonlabens ulvanivorans TaxID=906888 RepID=UPI003299BF87
IKKLLFLLLLSYSVLLHAQIEYQIIDNQSKEPISNVLVYYGDNSIYSNVDGLFFLPEELKDGELYLDGLGYEVLKIKVSDIDDYQIILIKKDQFLDAVVLNGEPIKTKRFKQPPSRKKHWLDGIPHYHGQEYGLFLIKENDRTDVRLTQLTVPIIKKNADWEQSNELMKKKPGKKSYPVKSNRLETNFLFRDQFYGMLSDSSFVKLNYPTKDFIVSGKKFKYELNYSNEEIVFPDNGILVSILNMGPCDENGDMLAIPRFKYLEPNGDTIKTINNIYDVPLIALHPKKKNESIDYFHSRYSDKAEWSEVSERQYPRTIGGPMKQLGLGYELEIFYY